MTSRTPDRSPLDGAALTAESVAAGRLWSEIRVLESTGSTNADAAQAARDGAPEGTVITAEQQLQGRGRLDRAWETVPGAAIAVSVVLRPTGPAASWVWLPLLTGLAVEATARRCGVAAELKWPNDVLVGGDKIAGILLERVETPSGAAAVVGVGLNVSLTADELPVGTASSLWLQGATITNRTEVLTILLAELEHRYRSWGADGGHPASDQAARLRDDYVSRCSTVGQTVRVHLPDGSDLVGLAENVDESGRLVVNGQAVSAGDVTHVRRA